MKAAGKTVPTPTKVDKVVIPGKVPIVKKIGGSTKVVSAMKQSFGSKPLPKLQKKVSSGISSTSNSISASHQMRFGEATRHEIYTPKGRKVQFQCEQFVKALTTDVADITNLPSVGPGERLFVLPLSPAHVGGALYEESLAWQSITWRRVSLTYTSSCDSTDDGSIFFQYREDPSVPMVDTGVDELSHATTLGNMMTSSIYSQIPVVFTVDPEVEVKRLTLKDADDPRFDLAGVLVVSVYDDIVANLKLGDLILSYDVVFDNPMMSYVVPDRLENQIEVAWSNNANYAGGAPMTIFFWGDVGWPPGPGANLYGTALNPPDDGTRYQLVLRCLGYTDMNTVGPNTLGWITSRDREAKSFEFGQVFYGELVNGALDGSATWDNGTIALYLSLIPDDDGGYNAPGEYMLNRPPSVAATNGSIRFQVEWVPLDPSE